jgi:hypothetical protein
MTPVANRFLPSREASLVVAVGSRALTGVETREPATPVVMAARVLHGGKHPAVLSPKVKVAVNRRGARLLGTELGAALFPVEVCH